MTKAKSTFDVKSGLRVLLAGMLLGSVGLVSACSSPTETTRTTTTETTRQVVPVVPPSSSVTTTKTQVYTP